MSASKVLLLCALSTVWLCLVGARGDLVVVCPDDYSPSPGKDCVPLHQLLSTVHLIHSNTTIQFLPVVFKLDPHVSISIANVSNITVGAAGPHRATISCTGSNSGFVFKNVSGLTVQNMNITDCASFIFDFYVRNKKSIAVLDCTNVTLSNVKFTTSGVYVDNNICGYFTTSNALFTEMVNSTGITFVSTKVSLFKQNCPSGSFVTISNSEFLNGHCVFESCAVRIDTEWPTNIYLLDVPVKNNTSGSSLLLFTSRFSTQQTITLRNFRLQENRLDRSSNLLNYNAIEMTNQEIAQSSTAMLKVTDSVFTNNEFNGIVVRGATELLINNTVFSNSRGSAVKVQNLQSCKIEFDQCTFTNITSNNQDSIVSLKSTTYISIRECTFSSNRGTSLMIHNSIAVFAGINLFSNNTALRGAAILLVTSLIKIYDENTTLYIQGNVAEKRGGGIFVFLQKFSDDANSGNCFLQIVSRATTIAIYFDNNTALLAGNDIYGGNLYSCNAVQNPVWYSFPSLLESLRSPAGYKMDMSSLPYRVCECSTQNIQTCAHPTKVIGTIQTYPGKTFNLSLLIVGQVLNISLLSGVPSAVYADILPENSTGLRSASIPGGMLIQKGSRTCSNLTYSINSTREGEVLALMAVDASEEEISQYWQSYPSVEAILANYDNKYSNVPAYIQVHFIPCPAGFNLSMDGACICSSALKDLEVECIIDTLMIRRKSSYLWLTFNISSHFSEKILVHKHCPFDYCRSDVVDFGLEDADALCNHNRSGILCGACRSGYSLILGGTECRQCSNIYLLLLLPFALAGILLVVFFFLTDMTVAAGTINGLLFYANIVTDNKASFFPLGAEDNFLSVFVQWLSLNFGIKSCFFDGLDAYIFTWLQLVFPIYICLLAFTIIVASRYITWMNRLCGSNTVHVLATLFLLSYTKVQATIASGLSFTVVEVSDGEKLFVWLKDGNVPYLQGKHIALFMVSLLLLCVFSLYTLSIALGPWLQRKTQYKVFCWMLKLKPLFDAYFGPLKNQYRYWTGLLLLSRTIIHLVSSVNVLGDDSVDLLAIAILCLLLTWQSRCVYKHRVLSALDSFFLINLCILALVSLYNKLSSGGSQTVTIYVSSGSAFTVFCVILLYHCISCLKKVINKRRNTALRNELSKDSDDEMLLAIDADRD